MTTQCNKHGKAFKLPSELKSDAWKIQARAAIKQGQSLADFVDHCEQSNRPIARKAYLKVRKEQGFAY